MNTPEPKPLPSEAIYNAAKALHGREYLPPAYPGWYVAAWWQGEGGGMVLAMREGTDKVVVLTVGEFAGLSDPRGGRKKENNGYRRNLRM